MKKQLLVLSSLLLLAACSNPTKPSQPGNQPEGPGQGGTSHAGFFSQDPDGSSMNQPESDSDRAISQNIKKAIQADNSLSSLAKNIQVTTNNGIVTLRGQVGSEREKQILASKVMQIQGVIRVNNQLEVAGGAKGNAQSKQYNRY